MSMTPLTFIALLALGVGIGLCLGAFIGALALRSGRDASRPSICPHCGKRHQRNVPHWIKRSL